MEWTDISITVPRRYADTAEAVALERANRSLSLSCGAVGSRLAASRSMRCRMAAKPGMV